MPRRPTVTRSIDSLHPTLRDGLDAAGRREMAALDVTRQRRRQAQLAGTAPIPQYLDAVEAEAPGTARLHFVLPSPFTMETAAHAGAEIGMGAEAVARSVDALRRAELLADGPHGMTLVFPSGIPF